MFKIGHGLEPNKATRGITFSVDDASSNWKSEFFLVIFFLPKARTLVSLDRKRKAEYR